MDGKNRNSPKYDFYWFTNGLWVIVMEGEIGRLAAFLIRFLLSAEASSPTDEKLRCIDLF